MDSFGRGGDGGTLIHAGAPQWGLLLFGLFTVPFGFWLWHSLGSHFGLGGAHGQVNWSAAIVSLCLLAVAIVTELAFYPFCER